MNHCRARATKLFALQGLKVSLESLELHFSVTTFREFTLGPRRAPCPILMMAVGFLVSVLPGSGQSTLPPDEAQVRQLYQQITYLTQVNTVTEMASTALATGGQLSLKDLDDAITSQEVTFTLGSFREGIITEIRGEHWTDFVTQSFQLPNVLELITNTYSRSEYGGSNVSWVTVRPQWLNPIFPTWT